jgi:GrpB-like predicted nucleotidyltransferase (UPF0157 family)
VSDDASATQVVIVEYDPRWPSVFEDVAGRIIAALAERAREVLHVGSTSVPGLAAKPVIDVNVLVDDATDEPAYLPDLEAAGFAFRLREPEWFEHRLLRLDDPRTNLHVFSVGCVESQRMVQFRDWLREHPDDRLLYERTKRDLATRSWPTMQHYAGAKTQVVTDIMRRVEAGS